MCGGVLEEGEGLVLLQALRNVPGALITDAVAIQTAIESKTQTSGGADACLMGVCDKAGTYLSEVRSSFILRASASWMMPDMSLP